MAILFILFLFGESTRNYLSRSYNLDLADWETQLLQLCLWRRLVEIASVHGGARPTSLTPDTSVQRPLRTGRGLAISVALLRPLPANSYAEALVAIPTPTAGTAEIAVTL